MKLGWGGSEYCSRLFVSFYDFVFNCLKIARACCYQKITILLANKFYRDFCKEN